MKKLLYLLNYEISKMLKGTFVVIALLFTAEFVSFMAVANNDDNEYLRFEELTEMSGFKTVFLISFIAILGFIAYDFYKNWIGSKSIYTLLCLPLPRRNVYISKLTAAILVVGLLVAAQLINIFFSYGLYLFLLPQVPKIQNGLLLAFLRWDFFKLFYPTEFTQALTSLAYIFIAVMTVIFAVTAQRASEYFAIAFMLISVLLLLILPFGTLLKFILMAIYIIVLCNRTLSLVKSNDLV